MEEGENVINTANSAIIRGTKYANAPGWIGVHRGLTSKGKAPMPHHSIPSTTEETTETPNGYCQCGCGQRVGAYRQTDRRRGHVKGRPWKFLPGHHNRTRSRALIPGPDESTMRIPMPLDDGSVIFAIVDVEDAEAVSQRYWRPHVSEANLYAKGGGVLLHRFILGLPPHNPRVDHIDGDGLNNRRENLRLATPAQNSANMRARPGSLSGFKGVTWSKNAKRWRAKIRANGRHRHLGYFTSEEEAARAYDDAARELHGEFACVNFPRPGERSAR